MKKWFIMLVLFVPGLSLAATTIPFKWVANPASDNATGYRLYRDGGYDAKIVQTILDPSANTTTYIEADDTVPHNYSLAAFRQETNGTVTESKHSDDAIWMPPVADCPECPECPECPVCPEQPLPLSFTGSFKITQDTE